MSFLAWGGCGGVADCDDTREPNGLSSADYDLLSRLPGLEDVQLVVTEQMLAGRREMVDILALVLQHDEQAVLSAVEMALEANVLTKTHILNLLHRLVDGKPLTPPTINAPQALTLTNEPKANVERYDALRKTEVRHAS